MKNKLQDLLSGMRVWATVSVLYVVVISGIPSAQAQSYKILFQFRAGVDGASPFGGLVSDPNGNLYGTTNIDGAFDSGVVFKLSPTGRETVLHSFSGSGGDGAYPLTGLVRDASGNLYGTTAQGGVYGGACGGAGCGTVFKVDSAGTETVLHGFTGIPDGSTPYAGLVRDAAGTLYGTTLQGGANEAGAVFKVDASGKETVLLSFDFGKIQNGYAPYGGLALDPAGNLYGTTEGGGTFGAGIVFKLDTTGTETVLYNFGSQSTDGLTPTGNLIRDTANNLYGMTENGGMFGFGTVFKVDKNGNETLLHSFAGGKADGQAPFISGLLRDAKGNLYGATSEGGPFDFGIVFKLDSTGKETVLHSFTGKGGKIPYGSLIRDKAGNLYGTTSGGGTYGGGLVFKLTP
jgi:uncharacterized repeat protein (TIGR03803 family)